MRRSFTSLIVGVVFGIVAVALLYSYISNLRAPTAQAAQAAEFGTVVVADKDVRVGQPVTRPGVKVVQWPKASIPQGAFSNADEIFVGATVPNDRVATVLIARDEPITRTKVSGF